MLVVLLWYSEVVRLLLVFQGIVYGIASYVFLTNDNSILCACFGAYSPSGVPACVMVTSKHRFPGQ